MASARSQPQVGTLASISIRVHGPCTVHQSDTSAGAFQPRTATTGSEWRFSFRFALGAKALFSERVGLRGEAGLLLPIQWAGGGIFCGGGGCSGALTEGTAVVQGSLGGGLTIVF